LSGFRTDFVRTDETQTVRTKQVGFARILCERPGTTACAQNPCEPYGNLAVMRKIPRTIIVLITVCILFALISRLAWLGRPFFNDAGLYVAIGKVVADGGRFYSDIWDTKLPSVAALMWPIYLVFGRSWFLYVICQLVLAIAAAFLISRASLKLFGRESSLVTLVYGLLYFSNMAFTGSGFQLETIQLFFSSAAAFVYASVISTSSRNKGQLGKWMLIGVLAAIGAMAKPTSLAVLVAIVYTMTVGGQDVVRQTAAKRLIALFTGVGIVAVANVAIFQVTTDPSQFVRTLGEISAYSSGTPWSHIFSLKTVLYVLLACTPHIVLGCLSIHERTQVLAAGRRSIVFVTLWLMLEVVGIVVQKRAYGYHFLPALAPASLLLGIVPIRTERWKLAVLAVSVVPAIAYGSYLVTQQRRYFTGQTDPVVAISELIRQNSNSTDAVFSDPLGALVVLSDRPPGARLGMMIQFINDDEAPRRFSKELLDDLQSRRPLYVVVPSSAVLEARLQGWESQPILRENQARRDEFRSAWTKYLGYVHENYKVRQHIGGSDIYRRVDGTE
jgi:hypothetical protein